MNADHNLLAGILALQMNFISRDQLVAAMHAWVLTKSRPLEEILVEQQALAPDAAALLAALIGKHLTMHAGDHTGLSPHSFRSVAGNTSADLWPRPHA